MYSFGNLQVAMQTKHLQATTRREPWRIMRLANVLPLVLLTLVIAVVMWLWGRMQNPNAYPLQHVKISTNGQYIQKSVIKNTILNNVHGGFFSLDVKQLKNSLLDNPWIQDVSIRRVWPSSLYVKIDERQPLARWGANGVLAVDGDVFYPNVKTIPLQLPEIDAPMPAKDSVMSLYAEFNQFLKPLDLSIAKLVITQRLAWTVLLSNGVYLNLCRDNVADRFASFVALYPKLIAGKAQDVVSVNLCYPQGLAIRWKGGMAPKI
jgi:cell division protein FtsQ